MYSRKDMKKLKHCGKQEDTTRLCAKVQKWNILISKVSLWDSKGEESKMPKFGRRFGEGQSPKQPPFHLPFLSWCLCWVSFLLRPLNLWKRAELHEQINPSVVSGCLWEELMTVQQQILEIPKQGLFCIIYGTWLIAFETIRQTWTC